MRPNHLTLFLLTLLLLAACVAPAGGMASIPTPTLLPAIPPHNGLLYIELPPAADPTATFTATIIDSTTDVPVVAVYPLEDITTRAPQPEDLLRAIVTGFTVILPAVYTGRLLMRADS